MDKHREVEPDDNTFSGYLESSPEYRRIAVSLFLAGLATFALLYDTQPMLVLIGQEFRLAPDRAALSVSASTIGLAVALVFAGPLSERHGRTPVIFLSLFVSSAMGIVVGLAPTWPLHLLARFVLGITVSGLPAVAMAYLAEEVHRQSQARAAGLYIAGTALGGMSGRLVTGLIADFFGWRAAVAGMGVLALLCAVAVFRLLPASRGFTPSEPGLKHLWEQTAAILHDRVLLGLFAVAATCMGSFVGVYNIMGYRLEAAPYHLSVGIAGLVFLVYALGSYASAFAGKLASKWGQRWVEPWAVTVMLVGLLVTLATPLWVVIVGLAIFTCGFFAVHGVAAGWVAARAKAGVGGTGQASSGYMVFFYAGSSIFGALAGTFWAWQGWVGVVMMAGIALLVALAIVLSLRKVPPLGAR